MERIERSILLIRGQKVMLDNDLASLYGVETKRLVEAVKRNIERFPDDFMFRLDRMKFAKLEVAICDSTPKDLRSKMDLWWSSIRPYAFTEQGVAMLSSVLRSPRAVSVNIEIMRAFVRLRQMLLSHADLPKIECPRKQIRRPIQGRLRRLAAIDAAAGEKPKRPIGFHAKQTP